MDNDAAEVRLSKQQKDILMAVYKHDEPNNYWGTSWHLNGTTGGRYARPEVGQSYKGQIVSPSVRASMSRAIRRLETRGLLTRMNWVSGDARKGTTHLKLTDVGKAVAKRLTSELKIQR